MALTLDDPSTLDVEAAASPRWQRFAGGRRLAHVGYRRRVIRIALGTIGASLIGAAMVVGDGRTFAESWASVGTIVDAVNREATATTHAAARSLTSQWDTVAAWARIDTPPRRQSPEVHAASALPASSPTALAVATAIREIPTAIPENKAMPPDPGALSASTSPGQLPSTAANEGAPSSGQEVSQPSPTAGIRQPAGTPIPVVTATPGLAVSTPSVPRPAPTVTAQRAAPTPARPAGQIVYQVSSGDTLWGIATRYGTSVDAILRANRLPDPDSIVPGARLVIPR